MGSVAAWLLWAGMAAAQGVSVEGDVLSAGDGPAEALTPAMVAPAWGGPSLPPAYYGAFEPLYSSTERQYEAPGSLVDARFLSYQPQVLPAAYPQPLAGDAAGMPVAPPLAADESFGTFSDLGTADWTTGLPEMGAGVVWSHLSRTYMRSEAMTWQRRHSVGPTLAFNLNTGETLGSVSNMATEMQWGQRVTVGYFLREHIALEGTLVVNQSLQASTGAVGNNNLSLPGTLPLVTGLDFFAADIMGFNVSTDIESYEANLVVKTVIEDFSWIVGVRYIDLTDTCSIRSTDFDSGTSDYRVAAQNQLYGGQAGILVRHYWGRWGFEGLGKAFLAANEAEQSNRAFDANNTFVLRDATGSNRRTAFVGEVGFNGVYILLPRVKMIVGYNMLWLANVATGSGQLDFSSTATSGTGLATTELMLHGINFGIESRF